MIIFLIQFKIFIIFFSFFSSSNYLGAPKDTHVSSLCESLVCGTALNRKVQKRAPKNFLSYLRHRPSLCMYFLWWMIFQRTGICVYVCVRCRNFSRININALFLTWFSHVVVLSWACQSKYNVYVYIEKSSFLCGKQEKIYALLSYISDKWENSTKYT